MTKWGRDTLPLVLRRHERGGTTLAPLLPPFSDQKWSYTGVRDDGHRVKPCRDQTTENQGASGTVAHWMRGGGVISYGIPLGHGAVLEWPWSDDMGLGGTLHAMERCMAGGGEGPP